MAKITEFDSSEVFEELRSSPEGLTSSEAENRIEQFGRNVLKRETKTPLPIRFARQLTNLFAILLWVAAILSFAGGYVSDDPGMLMIGYALVGVIFLNAAFTFYQEFKAERAAEALRSMLAVKAKVVREGSPREIDASTIVPGDIVLLDAGDRVPADARLIQENELRVNNSALTGESEPQTRTSEAQEAEIFESENVVFSGTTVVSGQGRAVVFATGMGTEFGKVAHLTQEIGEKFTPLQKELMIFIRTISAIAIVLGVVFFFAGMGTGRAFWGNLIFAIGIIVANVPEGLLPTVTLTLSIASQRMAKRNALIKSLNDVETLGSTTVICTDKTGTLTRNEMTVRRIYAGESEMEVTGAGYEPKGVIVDGDGNALEEAQLDNLHHLLHGMSLCNEASLVQEEGEWKVIGDPTEGALIVLASKVLDLDELEDNFSKVKVNPFDSQRKMMSTAVQSDAGRQAYVKGALDSLLPRCTRILVSGESRDLTEHDRDRIRAMQDRFEKEALRVIAVAMKDLADESEPYDQKAIEADLTFLGIVGMIDPPRREVAEAVRRCKSAGIKIIVITGDSKETALSIARDVGVVESDDPTVIEGGEVERMSQEELKKELEAQEILFARSTPKNKMDIVDALQDMGGVVAVTGDGVNDAPALKKADIGIAMGEAGTDVAKEAADMILVDDNFATIVNAVEEGRAVYDNIRRFVSYILTSNIPEIVPFIVYALFGVPLPLTVIQILIVDLGTDMVPATALGTEKPEKDVMTRPPRKRDERILKWSTLARSYGLIGPIEAAAGLVGYWLVLKAGGWSFGGVGHAPGIYMAATTACLAAIIVTQLANGLVSRTTKESVFSIGPLSNRNLLYGFVSEVSLILAVVYLTPLHDIFGTQPLEPWTWLIFIPFALAIIVVEEIRKYFIRQRAE